MAGGSVAESVAEARQEVELARRAVESELDSLGDSARSAFDIPAKVRRNPARTVGLGAGAAFLLLGGPKRVLKAAEGRVLPRRRPRRLLPKEIDRTLDRMPEEEQEELRAHLERDFASYLEREHVKEQPNARRSFWATYDTLVGILGAAAARELVKRFFAAPKEGAAEAAQQEAKAAQEEAKAAEQEAKAAEATARAKSARRAGGAS
ncbi:MAG: hypothetical protein M3N29_10385 [Chloroflexota bacterium]|nr:hypothetical protein [Chloroflexota bacterium]